MSEHQLLLVLAEIVVLVVAARVGGEIASRLGIPTVVGELVMGILLGPSLFGLLWPGGFHALFPAEKVQREFLELIGWIGVIFLVISAGMETRLGVLRQSGRVVLTGWLGGFLLPFAAGFAFAYAVPRSLIGPAADRPTFALFFGTAMSISAIPVIARILLDLGMFGTRLGMIIMSTALADDTIGWVVLGVVSGIVEGHGFAIRAVSRSLVATVAFVLFVFTIGGVLIRHALNAAKRLRIPHAQISTILLLVFLGALVTQAIGVHLVLGAFIVAIQVRRSGRRMSASEEVVRQLGGGFFTPFFFAYTGLNVDLRSLKGIAIPVALAAVAVACVGKLVGGGLGARLGGLGRWEAAAVGVGLNARGAIGLVIAAVGLSIGVLTAQTYATLVIVAISTTVMSVPLLRLCVKRIGGVERLDRVERGSELEGASP
jgi:Kef-type K+ transport system membrane component KefB